MYTDVVIGFEPDIYTVPENDGPVIVTVRILQGGPGAGRTIEVLFRTADGFGLTGVTNFMYDGLLIL